MREILTILAWFVSGLAMMALCVALVVGAASWALFPDAEEDDA